MNVKTKTDELVALQRGRRDGGGRLRRRRAVRGGRAVQFDPKLTPRPELTALGFSA